ncbi:MULTISPECIES: hypothetical protein [Streptomyces]|uniref:DUF1634 domain-containing protein n=1 Tax=Streptomyces lycii TaxID=2654337 RepID=A0ABQ7F997_9ACTN|nr:MULTISPECIES: hypothetical protein [Streptomyces]KAF4405401.1 hypothetical protein GCU69_30575 [Streptomyces lycii]PGH49968.1 hypothetical protein CRI70_14680 [Streptomyces sp. Ru87]
MEITENGDPGRRPRGGRNAADRAGLAALALLVLGTGAFVGLLGPLLAIACSSCQDGVRSPLVFGEAIVVIARAVLPLAVLGTLVAIFHPRGGARAGGTGLLVLVLIFVLMLFLGRFGG